MSIRNRIHFILAAAVLALLLTGCIIRPPEELFRLPMQTEEYNSLREAIGRVMGPDMSYSSPISGTNQQPVQMADLDGDGEDEAIVFLKAAGEHPLRTFVFDRIGDSFRNVCVIEGDGSDFAQVEYAQLDGTDGLEIIIGRQLNNQVLQSIGAYSLQDGSPVELMSASYSEFSIVDLDGDGCRDLFLLRFTSEGRAGVAELYRCRSGEMEREPELTLSVGIGSIRSIQTGNLTDGQLAIFVSGVLSDSSIITDIFTILDDRFSSISSSDDLGLHSEVVRGFNAYVTDIDEDGLMEIPEVVPLPHYTGTDDETVYSAIRWYGLDPAALELTLRETTFHSYTGGWFFAMPERIGSNFLVSRGNPVSGANGVIFYDNSGTEAPEILFTVYSFTGSERSMLASADGRFSVGTKSDTAYSVLLGPAAQRLGLSQAELTAMFRYIRINWNSGET